MRKPFKPYANNTGADPYNTFSFYIQTCKPLASLCGCAERFESYLVENPEDRFSRDEVQLFSLSCMLKLQGVCTIKIKNSNASAKKWRAKEGIRKILL